MITLDLILDEILSIEKTEEQKKSFFEKIRSFVNRKEINKQIQDEHEVNRARVIKQGNQAKDFLASPYYRDLIDPFIRQSVKSGLQKLLAEYQDMNEAQLKSEISVIRKCLSLLATLKLKVAQGEEVGSLNET